MIHWSEVPLSVEKYVNMLNPIVDFSALTVGQKIFNKESLDVAFIDTFISYTQDNDIVKYKNYKGEIWYGKGKDYWFFIE